ncbi:MAG: FAD-dependent oxidoreductase [Syntrophobacterales bacterium]|nr:MAG: FAD-dependent oxidoreductase [Syntrophobacterales bacterium]
MASKITYASEMEMPFSPVSSGDMSWNRTGTWRYIRPKYEDKTPPCNAACPAGIDIPMFIGLVGEGRYDEAWNVIREENPFPGVCGRVCFHPCESHCNRADYDEVIAINALERFVADQAPPLEAGSPVRGRREERVAVVGSGPSGLSCAYHLAKMGYQVIIFESLPQPGGILRVGIPSYRLPKDILDKEIADIQAYGVEIKTNARLGGDLSFGDLEEYEAIFLATGAHVSRKLSIPGEDLEGVGSGLDLLRDINLGKTVHIGRKVAVIGGGNTALDAARAVLRLGGIPVIVYRRSREEMPAFDEEVSEALEEGIKIQYLTGPTEIIGTNGRATQLECIKIELGGEDETGRRRPVPIPDSNFTMEVDTVIVAAGEEPDLTFLPEDIRVEGKMVSIDKGARTSEKGIFAGGDMASLDRTVAHAIGFGKRAAISIDCLIKKRDVNSVLQGVQVGENGILSMAKYLSEVTRRRSPHVVAFEDLNLDYFEHAERNERVKLPVSERIRDFREVSAGLTDGQALKEGERCFSCGVCNGCENCSIFCPDLSVITDGGVVKYRINYDYCKGCGICIAECPNNALSIEKEAK